MLMNALLCICGLWASPLNSSGLWASVYDNALYIWIGSEHYVYAYALNSSGCCVYVDGLAGIIFVN